MTESGLPIFDFTDADLKAALRRAFKVTAIVGIVLAVLLAIVYGWQTGMLLLAGTVISATGLWEWQRLVAFINAKLDRQQAADAPQTPGAARILTTFFLRLVLAGAYFMVV